MEGSFPGHAELSRFRETKLRFSRAAHRAGPFFGELFKRSACGGADFVFPTFGIIDVIADCTLVFFHFSFLLASRVRSPWSLILPGTDLCSLLNSFQAGRLVLVNSNLSLLVPQTGQVQSAGRSRIAVPGGMPLSGSPFSGS
jgi:hypothetical protein